MADGAEQRRQRGHFGEHLRRAGPAHARVAHALGQRGEDLPVRPRLPGRFDGLVQQLHAPLAVAEGAVLLGERRGGQHHVGEARGLAQGQLDHHQEIQRL